MKHKVWLAVLLATGSTLAQAQELKCTVNVNGQKINNVDPRVFQTMQNNITEFMNQRAFTTDVFSQEERIECTFLINLDKSPQQDVYEATVTVSASRPVYNSGYSTPMFTYQDNDWVFTYVENQAIEFNINNYSTSLSSLLSFYAYLIIGIDYESFGKAGGAKYFQNCETIMNAIPTQGNESKGWKPFDGIRNRYYIINHLISSKYEGYKRALYEYHFQGLDNFYDNPALARQNILNALDRLDKIARDNPNSTLIATFTQAKTDELIGIFGGADMNEKAKAVNYLRKIDPANSARYDKIIRN